MAILLMFLSSACFVTMSAMVKALGPALPITEIMFLRSLIAVPVLLALLLYQGKPLVTRARGVLLTRSLFGITAMFSFYYALTHMQLTDVVFIGRCQPIILALLAPLLVHESSPRSAWVAIVLGLAGAALVMRPGVEWSFPALVAFGATACSAVAHLMVRRLGRTDDSLVIVFNFTLLLSLASGLACLASFIPPTPLQWLLLMAIACSASTGQFLLTRAYSLDRAPAVAAASYASVPLSALYGYLFWREIPPLSSWLGGMLIVSGGIYLVVERLQAGRHARPPSGSNR